MDSCKTAARRSTTYFLKKYDHAYALKLENVESNGITELAYKWGIKINPLREPGGNDHAIALFIKKVSVNRLYAETFPSSRTLKRDQKVVHFSYMVARDIRWYLDLLIKAGGKRYECKKKNIWKAMKQLDDEALLEFTCRLVDEMNPLSRNVSPLE